MARTITRECKRHGPSIFVLEGRGFYRCRRCRVEAVRRARRRLKARAVAFLGGKCERCGYSKSIWALDFHHAGKKEFQIGSGQTRGWAAIVKELESCHLLCANCHRELHAAETNGTADNAE